jgi:hypothetical protein
MRVLKLTLKKKWFDMIASREKKEEYREIKPFWAKRFLGHHATLNPYFFVLFRHGYATDAPEIMLECKCIEVGTAKPEWSDNWQGEVFVIKLGDIIDPNSQIVHFLNSKDT